MSRELRSVGTFATPVEADALRLLLEAEGIRALLADEATVGMNWLLGNAVRGVKVVVADDDYARAMQIIADAATNSADRAGENASRAPWSCSVCGENVTADFEVCWACGASRDGQPDPEFAVGSVAEPFAAEEEETPTVADDSPPPAEAAAGGDESNPFRSPLEHDPASAAPHAEAAGAVEDDETALRAWRASVIGLVYCPPILQLYSIALLISLVFKARPLSPAASRHCFGAWLVNIAVLSGIAGTLFVIFGGLRPY